jgi:CubicO group peptidase (beta-lactamase class C family)
MNPQKIAEMEEAIRADYGNIAGMMIRENGATVYENYWNGCAADTAIHVFSVTKSIVSILIGIAVDRGYIESVDQKVLEFFPDYVTKRGEKTIQTVTVKTMLAMTAPYKYKSAPYTKYFTSDDWVKAALDLLGGRQAVGTFRYAPVIGPDILSGILVKATGKSVLDFAREVLFDPLGIAVAGNVIFADKYEQLAFYRAKGVSGWVADPQGVNTAGWGLTLTARDMAKIGELCLNGGAWNGRRIVSSGWLAESLAEHSRWAELDMPYGYLWWVGVANGYAAMGDGGNIIYVNPRKKRVVSIASIFKPTAKDRIEFIQKYIDK